MTDVCQYKKVFTLRGNKMENFEGKRLLILGGAPQSIKIVTAAKAMKIHTIVLDINEDAPAKKFADETVELSLFDYEGILAWCKANPVDGIINICIDYAQKTLQYLCERLNLPCFGNAEQVKALTDKSIFKSLCRENGLDVIPEYTEEEVLEGKVEFPLFVKPAECSGSRGAFICENAEDAVKAIAEAKSVSRNGEVIIEKYMSNCPDFMITYIFIEGEPYLQRTSDRYHGFLSDGMENVSALAISPSKYNDLFLPQINEKMKKMLKSIKMDTCAVFFQGFIDGDKIRFYDPGIRLPGANFENILKAATGIDIVGMFIEYALTGKITSVDRDALKKAYLLDNKKSAIVFPMLRPGKIENICGLEKVEGDSHVISSTYRYTQGRTVKQTGDVTQRFGEYNVLADSTDELKEVLAMIQKELVVLDENGQDMVISKPDINNI